MGERLAQKNKETFIFILNRNIYINQNSIFGKDFFNLVVS